MEIIRSCALSRLSLLMFFSCAALVAWAQGVKGQEPFAASTERAWLAVGDLRGHIEPCGCDPATDLGGVRRIAKVIELERVQHPYLKLYVLGNLLDQSELDNKAIKNEYILRALGSLKPTATLPGPSELRHLELFVKQPQSQVKWVDSLRFVLSNRTSDLQKSAALGEIPQSINDGDSVIYGYFYEAQWRHLVDEWTVEHFTKLLGTNEKSRRKVLLYRGPNDLLGKIVDAKLFDLVLLGNDGPQDKLPGQEEKLDESRLTRLKDLLQVPLGGQGLLRGGLLQNSVLPNVQDILLGKKTSTPESLLSTPRRLVTWLTPSVGTSASMEALFKGYESAIAKDFEMRAQGRLKDLATSPFAGVAACQSCHSAIVEQHSKTRHAQAMQTLVEKGKSQDPECVICHSVGSKLKGGFVSLKDSPFLANVQCENCHGPRKTHGQNPAKSAALTTAAREELRSGARQVCESCHNKQHSPKFQFETYWQKIKHP